MAGLAQQLAQFVAALDFPQLPAQAVKTVKRGALDAAGRNTPFGRLQRLDTLAGTAELYDRGR